MLTDGRTKTVHRKINNIKKGVNEASEMKPLQPSPAPAQRTSPTRCYETVGPTTGTSTNHAGAEECNRCRSNNPIHTTAVKTMLCVMEVCGFCGKRGLRDDKCLTIPKAQVTGTHSNNSPSQQCYNFIRRRNRKVRMGP